MICHVQTGKLEAKYSADLRVLAPSQTIVRNEKTPAYHVHRGLNLEFSKSEDHSEAEGVEFGTFAFGE